MSKVNEEMKGKVEEQATGRVTPNLDGTQKEINEYVRRGDAAAEDLLEMMEKYDANMSDFRAAIEETEKNKVTPNLKGAQEEINENIGRAEAKNENMRRAEAKATALSEEMTKQAKKFRDSLGTSIPAKVKSINNQVTPRVQPNTKNPERER